MPTMDQVNAQIAALPHRYIFFTRKEIRALPEILDEREHILALTSGIVNRETWLAVCTEQRLLFINRGMLFGLRQVQMPLSRVQSIDHGYGIFYGFIRAWDGMEYFTLQTVLRSSIDPFVQTVQHWMARATRPPAPIQPAAAPAMDLASQLERLAALRDHGTLTQEEFEAQKKKLLAG
ncbi:MAG: PH domain-containing protein [Alphaproteobacteria bacterium]|nr:PH domain-containing protein [Alphaproteobacteria bacterium]